MVEFGGRGEHHKLLPRGYEADGRRADVAIPDEVHSDALVGYCLDRWTELLPLHRWLVDTLQ